MSAIFGILRFDASKVLAGDLERMGNALAHRAPDGRQIVIDGPVGIGHCLMRVNREDLFEAQPLYDREADILLVADLRLDNRDDLAAGFGIGAAELRGLPDSMLVLRAYKTWGENCAEHLLGDFAFAIWDGSAKKLVLGRDHMGQRYVHYHAAEDFFAFATDIKALWRYPDVPRVLSDVRIGRLLLRDRSPGEGETLFDGISAVPGATVMRIGADGSVAKRRYWEPRADPVHENRDETYYVEAYRRVLGSAVDCRLQRIIRAPGVMFSGGYDSAAIAGLAGLTLAGSGHKLIAAASVMPPGYRGTIRHARPWVEMCARDMPHLDVRYVTREGKTVLTGLEQAFLESELPAGSYHFVTSELLSSLAGAGARLIMDGHGGDYTLHPRGQAALARFLATFQWRRFFTELRGHLRLSSHSLWTTLKNDIAARLLPGSVMALWKRARHGVAPPWHDLPINQAFAERLIAQGAVDPQRLRVAARPELNMRKQMAATLQRVTAGSMPSIAAMAARHGLELTRPFHDKRVVELALAIPQNLYVKDGRNRYLACNALSNIYPREFQDRWRMNDDEIPDFQRMAKSIEPQVLAEIVRMEKYETLSRMIDFVKIRRLLAAHGPVCPDSGWEQKTQRALSAFVTARYVEWFSRRNR